ncbi:probable indole-3-pyruvate monooxygenase YUCCA10 isoform X2 [Salvia miltiorrhiza]|uniref:probable indole-3-pyruvate monooxygenase YUCCA10 isoform X2 n=1 Tax=Salvia miltiorrhiza TaxID=226208 RepID=UPI0025AC63AF|nr:probable indole-3-pyruvate monooxygenase YUCCA10 isoform X2 [Salvia miltiorrhiza]
MGEGEAAVTIVGGGPSGVATAACLGQLSIPYTLLEREECLASLWQKHTYERVHLHLPKQFCHLPLMPIPAAYPTYLSRHHFLRYINDYASRFNVRPVYLRSVEAAAYDGEWRIQARNLDSGQVEEYRSRFLVVATGEACDARMPQIQGLESFAGELLHSTTYTNGQRFAGKEVLVVGSGNSGMEIALDLADYGAKTSIVIRSPIHILSRTMTYMSLVVARYLPMKWVNSVATLMSKIVYGDLTKYGIQRSKQAPFALKETGKYPVIDVGTLDKIKSGEIKVLPGIKSIEGNCVLFENEEINAYDVLIFATGFKRSTKQWLKTALQSPLTQTTGRVEMGFIVLGWPAKDYTVLQWMPKT